MPNPHLTDAQVAALADVCVVANTPAYLFKRLRDDAAVQELSKCASAAELLEYSHEAAADVEHLTLNKATEAYAALIAARLKPDAEFQAAITSLGAPRLRWAKELAQLSRGGPSTNTSTVVLSTGPYVTTTNSAPSTQPRGQLINLDSFRVVQD
jgi:hypothetical protein